MNCQQEASTPVTTGPAGPSEGHRSPPASPEGHRPPAAPPESKCPTEEPRPCAKSQHSN